MYVALNNLIDHIVLRAQLIWMILTHYSIKLIGKGIHDQTHEAFKNHYVSITDGIG